MREHHWQPSVIGRLFLDRNDHLGLYYWYDDVLDMIKEMEVNNKKR